MSLSPVVLFTYNRPVHLKMTLDALAKNTLAGRSKLFIFSDASKGERDSKSVGEVRKLIKNIHGFAEVELILREKNFGLADSVISGVSEIVESYGKAIVLEDDLQTSPNFLCFMNDALDFYINHPQVFSISGYSPPIKISRDLPDYFFLYRSSSWGWATWKDRWVKADWEMKNFESFKKNILMKHKFNRGGNDLFPMMLSYKLGYNHSWAIRWAYTHSENDGLCFYPAVSKVQNIGTDASGTNFTTKTNKYNTILDSDNCNFNLPDNVSIDDEINQAVNKFYSPSFVRNVINHFKFRNILK